MTVVQPATPPASAATVAPRGAVPVRTTVVGMRINRVHSVRAWTAVARAMGPMLRELFRHPELGMLGTRSLGSGRTITVISYWRSFEALEAYARATERAHRPAWTDFYRRAGRTRGAVGLFHETYTVAPGTVESLYVDVPADFGLGGAVGVVPVTGSRESARRRRDGAVEGPAAA